MPNAQSSGLHILVVEDNADCAESAAMLLRMYGHSTEVVANGRAALEAARAYRPDVVLLDIRMPGMDGWALAKQIEEQAGETKPLLIAITGMGLDEDRRHSAESGIEFHLTKPVDPEALEALLRRVQETMLQDQCADGRILFCPARL